MVTRGDRALFTWDRERIMKNNPFLIEFVCGQSKSARKSSLCWCGLWDEGLALDNRTMEGKQKYTRKPMCVRAYLSCPLRRSLYFSYHFEKMPDRNSVGSRGWFCPLYQSLQLGKPGTVHSDYLQLMPEAPSCLGGSDSKELRPEAEMAIVLRCGPATELR